MLSFFRFHPHAAYAHIDLSPLAPSPPEHTHCEIVLRLSIIMVASGNGVGGEAIGISIKLYQVS